MHIYIFKNKTNGKCYVGQTINDTDTRLKQHGINSRCKIKREKMPITNALHKYGWEGFNKEILQECNTQEELNEAERFWIAHYDCIAPRGYNLDEGGKGGGKRSPETKLKMSLAKIGSKISEEHRLNITATMKQKQNGEKPFVPSRSALNMNIAKIIRKRIEAGERQCSLALEYGVKSSTISSIWHNRTYQEEVNCDCHIKACECFSTQAYL